MSALTGLVHYPWITEKGAVLQKTGKYLFRVRPEATKNQIKRFVEETFHVHVVRVNTMVMAGKRKRVRLQPGYTSDWKKAIVTLKAGDKIDLT